MNDLNSRMEAEARVTREDGMVVFTMRPWVAEELAGVLEERASDRNDFGWRHDAAELRRAAAEPEGAEDA